MSNNKKSLLIHILAMFIFGSVGIARKFIPWASSLLSCTRGLIGALFIFIVLLILKKGKFNINSISKKNIIKLIISGCFMGIAWMLLFEAYNYTSVGVATVCLYMQATFVTIAAIFIFKEKLTIKKALCSISAIIGLVLVSGVIGSGFKFEGEFIGVLLGLGSAILYASVVLINKSVLGCNPYEKTFIQLLFSGLVLIPYIIISKAYITASFEPLTIVMVLVVGLIHTGLNYVLWFGSMEGLKAQTVAILSYVDPISALILSAIILGENIGFLGYIGSCLLIGAAIISEMEFKKKVINKEIGNTNLTDM